MGVHYWALGEPSRICVFQFRVAAIVAGARARRLTPYFQHCEGPTAMTGTTDPFSASIIPFEVPEQMRAFAEKGVSQARESYAKFKDAAESHNGAIEAVFTTASKGISEYNAKLMEFMKANTSASLDFAQELISLKSPSEALELWTGHTRKQLETIQAQAKELAELGQRAATETVEPIKASASKFYKPAA
jgi:phasin